MVFLTQLPCCPTPTLPQHAESQDSPFYFDTTPKSCYCPAVVEKHEKIFGAVKEAILCSLILVLLGHDTFLVSRHQKSCDEEIQKIIEQFLGKGLSIKGLKQIYDFAQLADAARLPSEGQQVSSRTRVSFADIDRIARSNSASYREKEKAIWLSLCRPNPSAFDHAEHFDFVKSGFIVARDCSEYDDVWNEDKNTIANMDRSNVMSLWKCFFDVNGTSIKDVCIIPGSTRMQDLIKIRAATIFHELLHCQNLMDAYDHKVWRSCEEEDLDPDEVPRYDLLYGALRPTTGFVRHVDVYGVENSRILAASDFLFGSRLAWSNAESWTVCAFSLMCFLAYPELDLSEEVITRRPVLSHHCSMLDSLRHVDFCRIRDLQGYNPWLDTYCMAGMSAMDIEELADFVGEQIETCELYENLPWDFRQMSEKSS